jgi:hypothetical protein
MAHELDDLLNRLAHEAPDVSLEDLEDAVLRGVARRRDALRAARAMAPVRVASVGLALAVGVAAGSMAAATTLAGPHRFDTFSSSAHLAPSTLLDSGR